MFADIKPLVAYIRQERNVKYYGYREARPRVTLLYFDRDNEEIERLEEYLYKLAGEPLRANHVLFEVTAEEYTYSLLFTDNKVHLGLGVKPF